MNIVQKLKNLAGEIINPATAEGQGTDGVDPPAIAGTGIRGWLRGIYERLVAGLTVSVSNLPATQPVSAASLPLPTGAATAAKQLPDNHNVTVSNLPATQPVSAASLPLPTGAATESTLSARNNAFATLMNALPDTTGKEVRMDDVTAGDLYIGRNADGANTATASWEVVRIYRNAATAKVERARYRTGVAWDSRTSGW